MSDIIIYEYPLSEKVRSYLRIEQLGQQLLAYRDLDQLHLFKPFFSHLFCLHEQIARGELKKELIRDLDNHKIALNRWRDNENIDKEQLEKLLTNIDSFNFSQTPVNKALTLINQDALLNQIKSKAALAGGGCAFDTPLLHYWFHLPMTKRQSDIDLWLAPLMQTIEAVKLLLQLLREAAPYHEKIAKDGFFQNNCEQNQLLRMKISVNQGCYPNISGYRNRYSIRFLSWNEQPLHDIKFDLACC